MITTVVACVSLLLLFASWLAILAKQEDEKLSILSVLAKQQDDE